MRACESPYPSASHTLPSVPTSFDQSPPSDADQGCRSGGRPAPPPPTALRGHSLSLDPLPFKGQPQCRTLKAQPFPQDWTGHHFQENKAQHPCPAVFMKREGRSKRAGAPPPRTALSRCIGSSALITKQDKQGLKILCLSHFSAGARKRTYSLYEQLKSKINEAKRETQNSTASEAAACIPRPAVPGEQLRRERLGGWLCMFTPEQINQACDRSGASQNAEPGGDGGDKCGSSHEAPEGGQCAPSQK